MALMQCPKCSAWMKEDDVCPFCGASVERQGTGGSGEGRTLIDKLVSRKVLWRIAIFMVVISLVSWTITLLNYSDSHKHSVGRQGPPMPQECDGWHERLKKSECWWSAGRWSAASKVTLRDDELSYCKTFRRECSRGIQCPRKEDDPDIGLPQWHAMKSVDGDVAGGSNSRPVFCQVKAAPRYRKPGSHYYQNDEDEYVVLNVENKKSGRKVWLSIRGVESRAGALEKGGFVKGSDVVYWVDGGRPLTVSAGSSKALLGGEEFYQKLKTARRLSVIFAVPDSKEKVAVDPAVIAYRVFALDNMDEVCGGNTSGMNPD